MYRPIFLKIICLEIHVDTKRPTMKKKKNLSPDNEKNKLRTM
jgi:hypothetical protein